MSIERDFHHFLEVLRLFALLKLNLFFIFLIIICTYISHFKNIKTQKIKSHRNRMRC